MSLDKQVAYWIDSANHDFEVAVSLYENRKYDWCLFIAHLVLEKILKGLYHKRTGNFPPRTHDLVRLIDMIGLNVDEDLVNFLDSVNTFNISIRYPDDKMKFYKICNKDFADYNLEKIKDIRAWLLEEIHR
jgi:HEPN domain-containing protein